MTQDLLPCPFCGQPVELFDRDAETSGLQHSAEDRAWDIRCKTPGCYLIGGADWYAPRDKIISRWNMRAEATQPIIIEAGSMVIGDTSGLHAVFDSAGQRVCYGERQVWP